MGFFDFFKKDKDDYLQEPVSPEWHKLYDEVQKSKAKDKATLIEKSTLTVKEKKSTEKTEPVFYGAYDEFEQANNLPSQGFKISKDTYSPVFFRVPEKNVIVMAIDNSDKLQEYSQTILNILSKIIEDNKDSLFLILGVENDSASSKIIKYEEAKELLSSQNLSVCKENKLDIHEQLLKIKESYETCINQIYKTSLSERDCKIVGYNIIFIGSAEFETHKEKESAGILKFLRQCPEVKAVKYFCIQDKQTINAARLGFSLIGHIESNFYK